MISFIKMINITLMINRDIHLIRFNRWRGSRRYLAANSLRSILSLVPWQDLLVPALFHISLKLPNSMHGWHTPTHDQGAQSQNVSFNQSCVFFANNYVWKATIGLCYLLGSNKLFVSFFSLKMRAFILVNQFLTCFKLNEK